MTVLQLQRLFGSLAVALLVATGCATSTPYQVPVPTQPIALEAGEEIAVDRVVVLFDASGSIHPKQTFPGEKAWVESFVQGMPDGAYDVSIRSFGGDSRRGGGLAPFDREQLAASANGIRYIGEGSPLDVVLNETAASVEGAGGRTAVVVVSDGVPDDPTWGGPDEPVLDAGRNVITQSDGEVCFHTVLAGDDPAGQPLLQSLSALTECGSYRASSSLDAAAGIDAFERDLFVTAAAAAVVVAVAKPSDADGDGVLDAADACPGTPAGAMVDDRGCWVLESVRFASNSDQIVGGSIAEVEAVAKVLAQNPGLRIEVSGYTDSSGAAAYNQKLSERRAEQVEKVLVEHGVEASRLETKGYGEANPSADNGTPEGRALNRRIEFTVLR